MLKKIVLYVLRKFINIAIRLKFSKILYYKSIKPRLLINIEKFKLLKK